MDADETIVGARHDSPADGRRWTQMKRMEKQKASSYGRMPFVCSPAKIAVNVRGDMSTPPLTAVPLDRA